MKKIFSKVLQKSLRKYGYEIVAKEMLTKTSNPRIPTLIQRLSNIKKNGFHPSVIVDGGAHIGSWTESVSKIFLESKYILVEPNPTVSDQINDKLAKTNLFEYTLIRKALGATNTKSNLNVWKNTDNLLTGSSVCEHIKEEIAEKIECELIQLDKLIGIYDKIPDLIKLDLQGYEIEALKGAKKCLEKTEVFIIEFGCLEAYVNRTSIHELINFMYSNQYCLYDIIDLHYRPYDDALTGGDFIFVKNDSALKIYKDWE